MPTRRGAVGALAIAFALAIGSLNSTSVLVILDDIEESFETGTTASMSVVAIYLIGLASLQPLGGRLGDRFGRQRVIIIGLLGFAISSTAAAVAPNLAGLIVFRGAQALFISAVIPSAAATVRAIFPERNRVKWMAAILGVSGIAGGLGPLFGGLVSDLFGWRYVFLVNLPIALVIALFVRMTVDNALRRTHAGVEQIGTGIMTFVVLALAFALLTFAAFQEHPDWRLFAWAIAIGGTGTITILLRSVISTGDAVSSVVAIQRGIGASILTAAAGNMAMYSLVLVAALLMASQATLSDGQIGLILALQLVGVGVTQLLGGWAADRFGRRSAGVTGRVIVLSAVVMLALAGSDASVLVISLTLFVGGCGMGVSNAAIRVAAMESVPEERTGMAYGLYSTSRAAGSIGAVAAFAAILGGGPLLPERLSLMLYVVVAAAVASGLAALGLSGPGGRHGRDVADGSAAT